MNVKHIRDGKEWFSVLQTSDKVQTAVMTLESGKSSGEKPEAHDDSEQVLLVLEGEVKAEVEGEESSLNQGDVLVIPAGVRHRFTNRSSKRCVTFNTYSPPEY